MKIRLARKILKVGSPRYTQGRRIAALRRWNKWKLKRIIRPCFKPRDTIDLLSCVMRQENHEHFVCSA